MLINKSINTLQKVNKIKITVNSYYAMVSQLLFSFSIFFYIVFKIFYFVNKKITYAIK
jgi:hypothetical protein